MYAKTRTLSSVMLNLSLCVLPFSTSNSCVWGVLYDPKWKVSEISRKLPNPLFYQYLQSISLTRLLFLILFLSCKNLISQLIVFSNKKSSRIYSYVNKFLSHEQSSFTYNGNPSVNYFAYSRYMVLFCHEEPFVFSLASDSPCPFYWRPQITFNFKLIISFTIRYYFLVTLANQNKQFNIQSDLCSHTSYFYNKQKNS